MYKATSIEAFGPFCGQGGFGSTRGVGFGRSPKQAIRRANRSMVEDHNRQTMDGGHVGGGVPIFAETVLCNHRGQEIATLPCVSYFQ
jgi:hypothetical protein